MEIRNQFNTLQILADMQQNIGIMKHCVDVGKKSVGLKIVEWATPMGLLPLAIYANLCGLDITTGRNNQKIQGYLRSIYFPRGLSNLQWAKRSSYLPISRFSIEKDDNSLTSYENLILGKISEEDVKSSFLNSLKYLTSEMVTNVKEHAQVEDYWIAAQYWRKTETCEIAIADTGRGYRESYRGTQYEVETHSDAITNAVKGNSSKNDVERGAGIPGMINLFCNGYGGTVVIMSGDALLYMDKEKQEFYSLDVDWQGVFLGLRFKLSYLDPLSYLG
jgi:anti-sigma regulatory factor (Ser/Thr protein kinase)